MRVILTDQALESLEEVIFYITDILGEEKALTLGRALIAKAMSLDKFSSIGSIEPELDRLGNQYRRIIYLNRYKIIYHITDDVVFITDFFDTRQDPAKIKG